MRFDDGCLDSATCYKLSQALLTGAGFFSSKWRSCCFMEFGKHGKAFLVAANCCLTARITFLRLYGTY